MQENLRIPDDTPEILRRGSYEKDGKTVSLRLTQAQMRQCRVFLPDDVQRIWDSKERKGVISLGRTGIACCNIDSFEMAQKEYAFRILWQSEEEQRVLVLSFADPVHPGGAVQNGAEGQECSLCRRSSLLLSLESEEAARFYRYNRSLRDDMFSDAMILTPNVEVFKDAKGELLDKPFVVSVLSCSAPLLRHGLKGRSEKEYTDLLYHRICSILKCAADWGYKSIILGAFGCGAFGNDAALVSDLFHKAIKEHGYSVPRFFRRIVFAVPDHSSDQRTLREFERNFAHFFREKDLKQIEAAEQRKKENEVYLDAIRGCLFGGAVGDALGYPVEFWSDSRIFEHYGSAGITAYEVNGQTGKALISDDTQMTLFTANALLVGDTRGCMRGVQGYPRGYVALAYQDWLYTQNTSYERREESDRKHFSWLCDVPELYARRAPGTTCLSALNHLKHGHHISDYIAEPRNNSKGCGGVMRIAPFPLNPNHSRNIEWLDMEAAQIAAITHGHSLGYMPAAVLCHIIERIVFPGEKKMTLRQIVVEAKKTAEKIFAGDEHLKELSDIIDRAIALSENGLGDLENIRALGEGWVAEETLAIAVYCSLRYENDFSGGVIAAVNHSGDSDSTGAVTGNILGALVGYEAIEEKWKKNLECADVILEMADDLCHGCQMDEYSSYSDPAWSCKYMGMHRMSRKGHEESPYDFVSSVNRFLRNGGV